jgi:nicotinate-nucleotide--dimethylbenzimidazole phosphoribosyltransferase
MPDVPAAPAPAEALNGEDDAASVRRQFGLNPLNLAPPHSAPHLASPQYEGSPLKNVTFVSPTEPSPVASPPAASLQAPAVPVTVESSIPMEVDVTEEMPEIGDETAIGEVDDVITQAPILPAGPPLLEPPVPAPADEAAGAALETLTEKMAEEPPTNNTTVSETPAEFPSVAQEPGIQPPTAVEIQARPTDPLAAMPPPMASEPTALAQPEPDVPVSVPAASDVIPQDPTPPPPPEPTLGPVQLAEAKEEEPDLLGGLEAELDRQASVAKEEAAAAALEKTEAAPPPMPVDDHIPTTLPNLRAEQ